MKEEEKKTKITKQEKRKAKDHLGKRWKKRWINKIDMKTNGRLKRKEERKICLTCR